MYKLKKVMSGRQHLLLGGDLSSHWLCFFGMTNSPPTFQNMMNDVLKDVIDHDEIVEEVLKRLKENDLFLKPEKCESKKKKI